MKLTLLKSLAVMSALGIAASAQAQLQWSSYDTGGNLVEANVATGGDVASGGSVTFTIPAATRMIFVTKSFTPINLTPANASAVVTFKFSASAGITGVAQRTVAWGLYNSAGTASLADDIGMYGGWYGPGAYLEGMFHASGSADLFSGVSPGLGKTTTGTPADGVTYTNQIRLFMKTPPYGVALGSSSSTLGAAGVAMNGPSLVARGYTNPSIGTNTFDEFGFMFYNTTAGSVTVTLSGIGLGNSLTWDASGTSPTVPTDGAGIWSNTNANWSAGAGGAIGASDSIWSPGYSAVIGANNGAAGTITIDTNSTGVIVSNLTFNAAGSGSYNIAGSPLIFTGTPTITVATGVTATNSAPLGGTAFAKAGAGTLALLSSTAATNVGTTTVKAGTLNLANTTDNLIQLNGNVTVNAGGAFNFITTAPIPKDSTLTINGGGVTNANAGGGKTLTLDRLIVDNNGILGAAFSQATLVMTNFDARSGLLAYPRIASSANPNCYTVKSTPGTVTVQGGTGSSSGVQGLVVTLNGGTLLLDYLNPGLYGDNAVRGRLINTTTLTLGGGTLSLRSQGGSGRTEVVGSTTLNSGATALQATNTGVASGIGLTLNAVTRQVGGTMDVSTGTPNGGAATAAINTTTLNNNGILGGWATRSAADWAVGSPSGSATSISAYSAYTTSTDPTTWATANNVSLSASTSPNVGNGTSINSLRLTTAATVALDGTLTLTSGGLLVTGSGATAITGGTLMGASGADLIVHQYASSDLTISSTLADNTSASSLTKSGPGKLIVSGANNMTGANYLNGGTVEVSDLAKLASGPIFLNNGALLYTGSDASSTRAVTLNGVGGTFDVSGGATLTQTSPVTGNGGYNSPVTSVNSGDWGGLTKAGSGTLVLAANNVYNGPTVVSNGMLLVDGINSLSGTSGATNYSGGGVFTVYGGTLGGSGAISGLVTIKTGGAISPGSSSIGTLTLASGLTLETGSTSLFEEQNSSSGDLIQIQGDLTIQSNSTIAISVLGGALSPTTNTLITYTGKKIGSFNPTVVLAGGSIDSSLTLDESTPGQIKLVAIPQVTITGQPQDMIVSTNDPATFSVSATGSAPIGYQWYFTTNLSFPAMLISGATSSSYTINSADTTNIGLYSVVVTNSYNSVTSRLASLIVGDVLSQLSGPVDQTVIENHDATFSATLLIANPLPTYQWRTNGVDVSGATTTSLTLPNVQYAALNGATVSLIASNAAGLVTNSATLTVIVPPVITPQLTDLTVNVGDTASFVSGATGHPAPDLQWYKSGVALSGETAGTLTINNAQGSDIATYTLVATNAAGAATNSAKLTVNSTTLAQTTVLPANNATGVCYDTPLYLTFNGPVSVVNSGKVRIYNAANPATPVDVIDLSSNTMIISTVQSATPTAYLTNNVQPHSLFSGDTQVINYFPVLTTGSTAAIYPHSGVMTSNQTYYVTMDNGVVTDSAGAYFAGISDTNAWRFTTKPTGPANPASIVVAADGSGDFVTVQGAVDSILPGNTALALLNIRDGTYTEIVNISGKHNLTFRGQSRSGTVVSYPNNNNLTGTTAGRMSFKVNGSDIKLENLTLINTTPQGGSQAETLLVYNNGLRCVVNNCDIKSRQDTILINASTSQAYFYQCEIYGNFDYVWGVGVGYFDHCSFHTITNPYSSSYNLTAARTLTSGALSATTPWVNPNGTTYSAYGFTFVNCTLQADPGVVNLTLAGSNGTSGGLDAWVNCRIDTNAYVTPTTTLSNTYVFWQNNNQDITGTYPVSFANVQTIGLTNNDPRLLAATNASIWFSGWSPQLAPNILTNPSSQTVNAGAAAMFTVVATGISAPQYQWLHDGTNAPFASATNATLVIPSAQLADAGNYSVIVSNAAGSVLSSTVTLTVNPPPAPTISSFDLSGGQVNLFVNGDPGFNYGVQISTNLFDWETVFTTNAPALPFLWTDSNTTEPMRFYRALIMP